MGVDGWLILKAIADTCYTPQMGEYDTESQSKNSQLVIKENDIFAKRYVHTFYKQLQSSPGTNGCKDVQTCTYSSAYHSSLVVFFFFLKKCRLVNDREQDLLNNPLSAAQKHDLSCYIEN